MSSLKSRFMRDDVCEIGIDECGRGCLWGPVCAAAVIWDMESLSDEAKNDPILQSIKDSKQISANKRAKAADYIKKNAKAYSIKMNNADRIDEINILQATLETMHACLDELNVKNSRILVDGTQFKNYPNCEHHCIIEGDNLYFSIAAASIIAKEFRDKWVLEQCEAQPSLDVKYNLKTSKGYGTKAHLNGIKIYGLDVHHRKTFGICKQY